MFYLSDEKKAKDETEENMEDRVIYTADIEEISEPKLRKVLLFGEVEEEKAAEIVNAMFYLKESGSTITFSDPQDIELHDSDPKGSDPYKYLENLKELFDEGVLSEEEYNSKRKKLLEQI